MVASIIRRSIGARLGAPSWLPSGAAWHADFANQQYYVDGASVSAFEATNAAHTGGLKTVIDSDGVLKWAGHNYLLNSDVLVTQAGGTLAVQYTLAFKGTGTVTLGGAATDGPLVGTGANDLVSLTFTSAGGALSLTVSGSVTSARLYRSDLGGMQASGPDAGDPTYFSTGGAEYFHMGFDHDPTDSNAPLGILMEKAATNILINSNSLSTQNVTTTAVAHTLHFTGTGTITLSGTSTAGPLVGTGTGEADRVSLTFTPTAGALTVTVTGTVTNAQLEIGSVKTSYIPTPGGAVTRVADALLLTEGALPFPGFVDEAAGTLVWEFAPTEVLNSTYFLTLSDGTNQNLITTRTSSGGAMYTQFVDGGVAQSIGNGAVTAAPVKYVKSWAANNFRTALTGSAVGSDLSGTLPAGISELNIGGYYQGNLDFPGHYARVTYYPHADFTDAELQALVA